MMLDFIQNNAGTIIIGAIAAAILAAVLIGLVRKKRSSDCPARRGK
ncbi:MAG: LPXTG cell wall anchor domain-containing protein [Oscillospiraceae bacterium]|jgi:LPXTG-motif cell wall-anchored protein|nr:LPXTG cell wall anchor domain-containing protein [Oscillospiraceae bacterium]